MSLDWDTAKIEGYLAKYGDVKDDDGQDIWHPVTYALAWYCVITGLNDITKENVAEFYRRMWIADSVSGTVMMQNGKETRITWEQLNDHIGFHSNASRLTKRQFWAKMQTRMNENAERALQHALHPEKR